jgi:hypothetical protein
MNLLCPNCQKMLTVPEQYAGQLMKCPLCGGTFTVPALPASIPAAGAPVPAAAAPPPPAPPAPSVPETFAIRSDGDAPAAPAWSPPPAAPPPAAPEHAEIPMVLPAEGGGTVPVQAPSTAPPEGYHRTWTVWFSPKVLPWVAPVCVALVFILQFFPWVGVYPGGETLANANAWGAAFAGGSSYADLQHAPLVGNALDKVPAGENPFAGASVLAIFYLLLFILLALPLTIASIVLDRVPLKLPPSVQKILPWRWGIVAAANLIVFLFLALQLLVGFQMESNYRDWVQKHVNNPEAKTSTEKIVNDATRGMALDMVHDTAALRLAVFFHIVGILGAALAFWVERRGKGRPVPRLELMW